MRIRRFAGLLASRWWLLLGGLLVAGACAGTQLSKSQMRDPGQMLFNGRVVAHIDCYRCHSGDATGTWKAPDLIQVMRKLSDEDIRRFINEGSGMMPAYKGKIDDSQIAQITAWLRAVSMAQ
jgi:mono/diheme cytochrome c family protein